MTQPWREPVLTVKELSVHLSISGRSVAVVDGISFELQAGEIVGLVGESGSGKTLAASALLGMVPGRAARMTATELRLAGRDLLALDERNWRHVRGREISMIFQEPLSALDPVFTIGHQLTEVIRRHQRASRGEARQHAARLLGQVGFPEPSLALQTYPHELSGGMRQRVMIAMALSCKPRLVVADEPTSALDVTTQAQILDLLERNARSDRTAVLLVTHDLAVVRRICDRALVMYGGRIVEEGPVEHLLSRPAHPYTAALLAALPLVCEGAPPAVRPIAGHLPAPDRLPSGCRFSDRCEFADRPCREHAPPMAAAPASPSHRLACHHPIGEAFG